MRPPNVIVRRAVLDPLWVPLAVALAGLLALIACAGVLTAPFAKRGRLFGLATFGALYVLTDAALVICCAWLFLARPVRARRRSDADLGVGQPKPADDQWLDAHSALLRRALRLLTSAARPLVGFRADVEQMPAPASLSGHPLLVLARHGGPGDSMAIVELLMSRLGRRPVIVLKEVLRWDPGLDVVLGRMQACFVPARAAGRDVPGLIGATARGLRGSDAILLFPEGGNWTPARHRKALARLRSRGRRAEAARAAENPHVLPPQPAGVLACLAARPDLRVILVAHTGLEDLVSAADVWRALPLTGRAMTTRWWKVPDPQLPADSAGRREWLDVQWSVVDSWIDARKSANLAAAAPR
jgi:1-acyl-sn-glycerol-3-phosphate acyltransferase